MSSSSSYVLFSQTSRPFGTRDLWGPAGLPGDTAGAVAGLVNGVVTDFPLSAFTAFTGTDVRRSDWALLALGPTADTAVGDGRVFDAPAGPRNPEALLALDPAAAIVVQLADADWNGIKNLELFLGAEDMADGQNGIFGAVITRNIVDVRVKIGDGRAAPEDPVGGVYVDIENVKRGEIDATESPHAVAATVTLTSNGPGWGNTFAVFGSEHGDTLAVWRGGWDAPKTTLDGFRTLANDGRHSLVVAELGAGNDRFDAGPLIITDSEGNSWQRAEAVRAQTDIRMGPDGGGLRILSESFSPPDWYPLDPSALGIYPTREMTLFFEPVEDPNNAGEFVFPAISFDATFLLNGRVVAEMRLEGPGGDQAGTDWSGNPVAVVPLSLGGQFFDTLSLAFLPGNEAELRSFSQPEGIYGIDTTGGDRVISSDGADVLRYAAGDGVDRVERFDPVLDRIVLEGIARDNVVVLGGVGDFSGTGLGFGALVLTDLASLPPPGMGPGTIENFVTDAAIFLPGTSAAAVEAALIFA
ncbi:hypothetical protein [Elioraea sp.]|uniref:hypothetical protein n=1 Tax=Elioraea sp. TaxID=2185103 RepID=UPI0025B82E09|nr:hypothetical protein [Elioraea sp.]